MKILLPHCIPHNDKIKYTNSYDIKQCSICKCHLPLGPRPECAPQWHKPLFDELKNVELAILIGM